MSLTKAWAPFFQSSVRMRGRGYYLSNRVEQVQARDGEVHAQVRGSRTYNVTLRGSGSDAEAECNCAFFSSGSYCKHIWAVILHVQHHGANGSHSPADTASEGVRLEGLSPRPPKARRRDPNREPAPAAEPDWVGRLSLLRSPTGGVDIDQAAGAMRRLSYVIKPDLSAEHSGLVVEVLSRHPTASGWSKSKRLKLTSQVIEELADPIDRELCSLLLGSRPLVQHGYYDRSNDQGHALHRLPAGATRSMLRKLIDTGRCCIAGDSDSDEPALRAIRWDAAESDAPACWTLYVVGRLGDAGELLVGVELRRQSATGLQVMDVFKPALTLGGREGVVIYPVGDGQTCAAAPLDDCGALRWLTQFREDFRRDPDNATIRVPAGDIPRFFDRLYMMPNLPEIDMPEGLGRPQKRIAPEPHLELYKPTIGDANLLGAANLKQQLVARVSFAYGSQRVVPGQPGRFVTGVKGDDDQAHEVLVRRDHERERQYLLHLLTLGYRPGLAAPTAGQNGGETAATGSLPVKAMPAAVESLVATGWRVTADQRVLRNASASFWTVTSDIDWFELRGGFKFQTESGEQTVGLRELLAAAKAGKTMVELGDGSTGILPQQWLKEHGLLAALGELEDDHFKFKPTQAAMLDALLAGQNVNFDQAFAAIRSRLRNFEQIKPIQEPPTFTGSLRPYQREGLGWFHFLRTYGMGGILADDMGLGKTVQVLALLDSIYDRAENGIADDKAKGRDNGSPHPTLIVVPRSVVFNWIDEARRFAPKLRVQAYTGAERKSLRDAFVDHDVIVTSYGLMRRDIVELRKHEFEYVVLDEAQAIKNPASQSAKAARLLRARHRLALTGTPVENHLGDLWSIFEFLNPGMLGSGTRFTELLKGGPGDAGSVEAARQAGRALRPFILRRTKKQVLSDLPEKTEQTILCTMEEDQRKFYDGLLAHYRTTLLKGNGQAHGSDALLGKDAMMVLEALLRLRQAACHPGLVDQGRADQPSAKIDELLVRLDDLVDEGHKALVFSQFTSLLALVRKRLDERGVAYEYLDGQTRDRERAVRRFQTDDKCPVFLISLKAGGLGLNLTAADYVFILDPWWNPAVEAQAIDRAHRIGQTQHVFAYRLICENTVEQRIAELQERKKSLADAIVEGQENLLRTLTRQDLEMLLS